MKIFIFIYSKSVLRIVYTVFCLKVCFSNEMHYCLFCTHINNNIRWPNYQSCRHRRSRTSSERLMYVQFTSCVYGELQLLITNSTCDYLITNNIKFLNCLIRCLCYSMTLLMKYPKIIFVLEVN